MSLHDHACLESVDGQAVTLLGARLTGQLRGLLFEARVEQRFANPCEEHLEVVYRFPLPWGAVLLGVEVELGGKRLTGAVVARAQAEADYEEALSEGDAAIMLEKNHDDSYCLNLGNLAPRESCTITLRYAQVLQFEQGALRLLVPTTIAPRYEDEAHASPVPQHQRVAPSLTAEHGLELELTLHGSLAGARVASPSHSISVAAASAEGAGQRDAGGGALRVALARQAWLDRDFVLVLDQLKHSSLALAGPDYAQREQVVVLASFCPHLAGHAPLDVAAKILVDCSGSMGGDSIEAARRALQAVVQQLRGADRFSLSRFGSRVEHRSRGLWKVSDATRLAAQRWVGALEADLGGTRMQLALQSTLQLAHSVRSDVLLVTDGQIGGIEAVVAAARGSEHRVFVVGIGASVAQSHLHRLAAATGGACEFVAPGEAVEPAVLRMFARLRSPHQEDLRLLWPGDAQPLWVTALPPAVFDGDTVNVFAGFAQMPEGAVRLIGRAGQAASEQELGRVALDGKVTAGDILSRVAAAARIDALTLVNDAPADALADGVRLAVDYQLVTEETNFLLVHARAAADKAAQMPRLHQERPMLAAGWGAAGSVSFSRTTADVFAAGLPALAGRSPVRQIEVRALRSMKSPNGARLQSFLDDLDGDAPIVPAKPRIDRNDPRYWSRSEFYTGLTPLGLHEWLRINAQLEWPTTYAGLRDIGLGTSVVEWLEFADLEGAPAKPQESDVVEAFLVVMAAGVFSSASEVSAASSVSEAIARLQDFFLSALSGCAKEKWPEEVWIL